MSCSANIVSWIEWPCSVQYILLWMHEHQTLIAGALSIVAAWLTIRAIQKQIRQSNLHRQDDISRKHRAIKSGLPIALSEITNYAEESLREWDKIYTNWKKIDEWDEKSPFPIDIDRPVFPAGALDSVQNAIETASPENAQQLAKLIAVAQIHNSRSHSELDQFSPNTKDQDLINTKQSIKSMYIISLILKLTAENMYEFGRGLVPEIPNANPGAKEALNRLIFTLDIDDEVEEHVLLHWDDAFMRYDKFHSPIDEINSPK